MAATPPTGSQRDLTAVLLEFHRAPGRHSLISRQPAVAFNAIREVLQLASGRSAEGDDTVPPPAAVQHAAAFFIRSALLYPGADHYTLLGVDRTVEPATVKERYRLLMRLIHPDFAGASGRDWPSDAAVRVNKAYEVLSSMELRRAYDDSLAGPVVLPQSKTEVRPAPVRARATPSAESPRYRLMRLAAIFGGVGALSVLVILFAGAGSDKDTLVQRKVATTVVAQAPTPSLPAPSAAEPVPVIAPAPSAMLPEPVVPTQLVAPAPTLVTPALEPARPVAAAPPKSEPVPKMTTPAAAPAPVQMQPAAEPPRPAVVAAPVLPTPQPAPSALVIAVAPVQASAPATAANAALAPIAVPAQAATTVAMSRPAAAPPLRPPVAGLTLAEAQPLLSDLLSQMESGLGDRILSLLDREARRAPGAQALSRHYNALVEDLRPVKIARVQFKAEPREGSLLVTGYVRLQIGDQVPAHPEKEFTVQAEFASREGKVVLTHLGRGN